MPVIKKLFSFALCLLMMLSFSACSGDNNNHTTTTMPKTAELVAEGKALKAGDLLGTLYLDCDSLDYQNLTGKVEHLKTEIEPKTTSEYFRFVSPEENVEIRLEAIEYSPIVDSFEVKETIFKIIASKYKIYEFECMVTETIPVYRLVAACGKANAEYYFVMDGYEVVTKLQMIAESPEPIEQDSAFYQLCVARAVSDVFYNNRLEKYAPSVVWDTLAYAVTLNEFKINGQEDYINMIGLSDWEASTYFSTLYPTLDEEKTELENDMHVVVAHASTGEKYLVEPHTFDHFATNEFYGVEDNGNGTFFVKIRVDDCRSEDGEGFGVAVIVETDTSNPFGYVITDVVDCDLSKG